MKGERPWWTKLTPLVWDSGEPRKDHCDKVDLITSNALESVDDGR
jgi:hypothetical protein